MLRIEIELAVPADDPELRELQSRLSMPGPYQITYLREPSFFKALDVEGRFHQTIVGREQKNKTIVGWGNRSVKSVHINGVPRDIGYLSGLRTLGQYDNVFTILRAYKKLRQLHRDGRTEFYLTTILDANTRAKKILTSGLRGLPTYQAHGQLHCKAIILDRVFSMGKSSGVLLRSATRDDLPSILNLLHEQGREKQFYPVYQAEDISSSGGLLPGLRVEDLMLALQGDDLVGMVGVWNQQSFRASRVTGYARWLAAGRPLYNVWARLNKLPILPNPGTILNYFYLSLIAVRNDDHDIFQKLLNEIMLKYQGRYDFMMAGLHSSHPLFPVLRKLKGADYISQLYLVYWPDGVKAVFALDDRPVYLELGAL